MASESKKKVEELEEVNGAEIPDGDIDDNASDCSEGGNAIPEEEVNEAASQKEVAVEKKEVVEEKKEAAEEKKEVVEEKKEAAEEKKEAAEEKKEVVEEKKEVVEEKKEVAEEKKEVLEEKKEVAEEKKDVAEEKKEVAEEKKEVAEEKKDVVEEKKEVEEETKEVVEEKKEVAEEKKEVVEEKKEVVEEKKEVAEEKKEVAEEKKEVAEEKKEVAEEKKEVAEENKEVVEEKKEVTEENKEVTEEKKEVPAEPKEVVEKKKEAVEENKEVAEEKKDVPEEPKEVAEEKEVVVEEKKEVAEQKEEVTETKEEAPKVEVQWTEEEDKVIDALGKLFPNNVKAIVYNISSEKSAEQIELRYKHLQAQKLEAEKVVEQKLEITEVDEAMLALEKIFPENYVVISKNICGNMTANEIEARLHELSDYKVEQEMKKILSKAGTEEDKTLLMLESTFPQNFEIVAQNMAGSHSAEELKARHAELSSEATETVPSAHLSEEDRSLVLLEGLFKGNWEVISKVAAGNQSVEDLKNRFENLEKKESMTWTEEEDRTLLMLVQIYKDDWASISRSMKHSAHHIERRFHELSEIKAEDEEDREETYTWTEEQDKQLMMLHGVLGANWKGIAGNIKGSHFAEQVELRYEELSKIKSEDKEVKEVAEVVEEQDDGDLENWTEEQDKSVLMLQKIYGDDWVSIARSVKHSPSQVEHRYTLLISGWTEEQEKNLLLLTGVLKGNWKAIARNVGHTIESCKEKLEELEKQKEEEEKKKVATSVVEIDGWTEEEDKSLLMLQKLYKGNWEAISRSLKHSAADARKRYDELKQKAEEKEVCLVETLYGIGELVSINGEHATVKMKYGTVYCNEDMLFRMGQWNEKQDKLLLMLVDVLDSNWKAISRNVGHNEEEAETRYHMLTNLKEEKEKIQKEQDDYNAPSDEWTEEEDRSIKMLYSIYKGNWNAISRSVRHSAEQVEERYYRITGTWTEDQDNNLLMLQSMLQSNWKVIARQVGHSESEAQERFEYLTGLQNHDEAELDAKEAEDEANFEVKEVLIVDQEEYDGIIAEIVRILDTDNSGTIDIKELQALYPTAADFLLTRFDYDGSGDLDVDELKSFINSTELAKNTLSKLVGMKEDAKVTWTTDQDRIILMLHKIYGDNYESLARNVEHSPAAVEKRLLYLQQHAANAAAEKAKPKKRIPGYRPSIKLADPEMPELALPLMSDSLSPSTPDLPPDLELRMSMSAPPEEQPERKRMPGSPKYKEEDIASQLVQTAKKRDKRSPSVSVKKVQELNTTSPRLNIASGTYQMICPYAKFGCTSRVSEDKLANHEAVQAVYHLSLVQKAFETLQEKYKMKEEECEELQLQLNRERQARAEN